MEMAVVYNDDSISILYTFFYHLGGPHFLPGQLIDQINPDCTHIKVNILGYCYQHSNVLMSQTDTLLSILAFP